MNINDLTGQAYEFAVACYDTNSIDELREPHSPSDADATDCAEWSITPDEWSAAIDAALLAKINVLETTGIEE